MTYVICHGRDRCEFWIVSISRNTSGKGENYGRAGRIFLSNKQHTLTTVQKRVSDTRRVHFIFNSHLLQQGGEEGYPDLLLDNNSCDDNIYFNCKTDLQLHAWLLKKKTQQITHRNNSFLNYLDYKQGLYCLLMKKQQQSRILHLV